MGGISPFDKIPKYILFLFYFKTQCYNYIVNPPIKRKQDLLFYVNLNISCALDGQKQQNCWNMLNKIKIDLHICLQVGKH